jgi:hypothetical protein
MYDDKLESNWNELIDKVYESEGFAITPQYKPDRITQPDETVRLGTDTKRPEMSVDWDDAVDMSDKLITYGITEAIRDLTEEYGTDYLNYISSTSRISDIAMDVITNLISSHEVKRMMKTKFGID